MVLIFIMYARAHLSRPSPKGITPMLSLIAYTIGIPAVYVMGTYALSFALTRGAAYNLVGHLAGGETR